MSINIPEKANFFILLCLSALALVALTIIYNYMYVLPWIVTYIYALLSYLVDAGIKSEDKKKAKWIILIFLLVVYLGFFIPIVLSTTK